MGCGNTRKIVLNAVWIIHCSVGINRHLEIVPHEFLSTKWLPWGVAFSGHFRIFRLVLIDEPLIHCVQPACNTHRSWLVVGLVLGSEAIIRRSEDEEISTRFPSKEHFVSLN